MDQLLNENKDLSNRVVNLGMMVKDTKHENTELKDIIKDTDMLSARQSVISKSTVQVGTLDALKERAHSLLKRLNHTLKQATKVEQAYLGTVDLLKNWTRTSSSQRISQVEEMLIALESMGDGDDLKLLNQRLHSYRQREIAIEAECIEKFRSLIADLEADTEIVNTVILNKSKKITRLKTEMNHPRDREPDSSHSDHYAGFFVTNSIMSEKFIYPAIFVNPNI